MDLSCCSNNANFRKTDAVKQHQKHYKGDDDGCEGDSQSMGSAAAMQALKMVTGGASGNSQVSKSLHILTYPVLGGRGSLNTYTYAVRSRATARVHSSARPWPKPVRYALPTPFLTDFLTRHLSPGACSFYSKPIGRDRLTLLILHHTAVRPEGLAGQGLGRRQQGVDHHAGRRAGSQDVHEEQGRRRWRLVFRR